MTRRRLQTDAKICMYALKVSTTESKNIKEAMLDHSWIKSMQEELNQFKSLDVWELVECPTRSCQDLYGIRGSRELSYLPDGCQTAFLNGPLKEEVFVSHPDGFVDPDFPNYVYRLKKALYSLKQAPRACTPMATVKLDAYLQGIPVDQRKYQSMIGGLVYLTASRPNITFATSVCARYHERPTAKHLKEVKRIFRYLRQTINMGLRYSKDFGFKLIAYSDADHVGCNDDCKSTSRGIQFLGDKLVSWSSKKQDCTTMSTAEAKHVSLSACCAQVIWMRTQLLDYGFRYDRIPMFLAIGWLLEEIHITWAHLEKKRTRLRTYTKSHEDICKKWLEMASQAYSDAIVINLVTASGIWRRRLVTDIHKKTKTRPKPDKTEHGNEKSVKRQSQRCRYTYLGGIDSSTTGLRGDAGGGGGGEGWGALLQAPTEGYGDAIVIPAILAENFELKHGLLNLVTSKQFCGFEKEDPHAHIRWFNKITSTIKYKDVPNSSIKLMLFPFSIEGTTRIWLEKEPPHSIVTWEDLVSKFINQFFSPSKTTNLRNEITHFQQRFDESFCEAWKRFIDLLRACPHHGFTELHQIDTFYNSLTSTDQDSLNAAAGGNLLTKTPKDALTLIDNKSKPLLLKNTTPPPAFVKAVEESCVTCGGPHPYYQCLATDGNASGYQDNIQAYVSAAAVNYNQGNARHRPPSVAHQV
ncbi:reverse transcriptase domain-containing protein [Tanacetum coccineum]